MMCWRSVEVGGGRVAEPFGTEGEWVVGAHRAQHDVGPVVGEGVVDLGDAVEAPAMLAGPRRHAGRRLASQTVDSACASSTSVVGAGEAALRAGEGLVGAGDVVASAAPQPGERTEPGAFVVRDSRAHRSPTGVRSSARASAACARSSSACWSGGRVAMIAAWWSRSARR